MNGFLVSVKRAAVEAVEASKPAAIVMGKVISTNPLTVRVDQKLSLGSAQLVLTSAVRDFKVSMTVDHVTEMSGAANAHTHAYKGEKEYNVHLGLRTGEHVLMLRADGGQKFIILDRLEVPG